MFAVIMAGGAGTRFWPASRKTKPKQFLNITGKAPMVVETCERLRPLTRDADMVIVIGKEHLEEAENLFRDRQIHMLVEPIGRNTAPCIGLGAFYVKHLGYNGPVAFLPADHFIGDASSFVKGLKVAGELANSGAIVTLGITPTRPETGYGYIQREKGRFRFAGVEAYKVAGFVEKPDLETARHYLESGDYYWNAGIFVGTPDAILYEIRELLPELYGGLLGVEETFGTQKFEDRLEEVYESVDPISFDYGVMEKTKRDVLVLPCECGWSDVGSWQSLYELMSSNYDRDRNLAQGETLLIDCKKSFISGPARKLVVCLGLEECLVVDTPDTLLVADLGRSQDIRKIVGELKTLRKEKLL